MLKTLCTLLILGGLVFAAAPAWAGERVDGHGWAVDVPDGFVETMSMESNSNFNVTPRFGSLPIERVHEMKAFVAGDASDPTGVLIVTRVDLLQPVRTSDDLGIEQWSKSQDDAPPGMQVTATTVGEWNAAEITFRAEQGAAPSTTHVLVVAAGNYCVTVMLTTRNDAFNSPDTTWAAVRGSLDVDPPLNKWVLFGLIGFGALGALWLLGRFGSRQVRDTPDHAGRWQRPGDPHAASAELTGLAAHKPMETGVRPKVLPNSGPRFESDARDATRPPPSRPMPPAVEKAPAVTRPIPETPAAPPGLRTTRPASGQWGR